MSFLDAITKRDLSPRDPALKAVIDSWGGAGTISGANITPENSLKLSGWYAGVQIIAGAIASLPCITYQRLARGKDRAINHPNYRLLHDQPNPFMTPTEFFETSQAHILGWGNSFAMIERNRAGQVIALWPMAPSKIKIEIRNGRLWYTHFPVSGGEEQIPDSNMLHVRGLGSDGIVGYSPVDLMRETLGLAKVEEEYRSRFFRNDARPGGIIEYPGVLSDAAYARYKADWQETYGGIGNKFRLAFLEQGLTYHDTAFTPDASQFIEGRKFQLEEIARALRIPLVLLQSTEKATSWGTGIEQFMLGFVQFTVREWLKRWERRLNLSLFTEQERRIYFCEFLVKDLLRADSLTEAQVLQIERRNGIINANDWLELTTRNPLPGTQGETYVIESNMQRLDQVGQELEAPALPEPEPRRLNGSAH